MNNASFSNGSEATTTHLRLLFSTMWSHLSYLKITVNASKKEINKKLDKEDKNSERSEQKR